MPSTNNHSPGSPAVSSAGSPASKNAGELAHLSVLISQSGQAVRLFEGLDDDRHQAALADLAAQSSLAADALHALEQATGGLQPHGGTP
jgi:hypothetical protein